MAGGLCLSASLLLAGSVAKDLSLNNTVACCSLVLTCREASFAAWRETHSILWPSDVHCNVITPHRVQSQQGRLAPISMARRACIFFLILCFMGLKGTEAGGEALKESRDEMKPAETCPSGPRAQSILENTARGWRLPVWLAESRRDLRGGSSQNSLVQKNQ